MSLAKATNKYSDSQTIVTISWPSGIVNLLQHGRFSVLDIVDYLN